jgi:hypothetical protein
LVTICTNVDEPDGGCAWLRKWNWAATLVAPMATKSAKARRDAAAPAENGVAASS